MSCRLALVFSVLFAFGCSRVAPEPWKTDNHVIITHRSGRMFGPIETAPSFRASLLAGADALDVDLRVTHDNVIVCAHDDWVATRECFGPPELLDWPDLACANVGPEFSPDFPGARFVTFDEFVRFCAENGIPFHLESKAGSAITPAVIAIIDRHKAMPLSIGMDKLRVPKRDDYRPVPIGVQTPGAGGDDDPRFLIRAAFRHEGSRLKINIDDPRMLADLLGRRGSARPLGMFRFDVPLRPALEGKKDVTVSRFRDLSDPEALRVVHEWVRRGGCGMEGELRSAAESDASPALRAVSLWALGVLRDADGYPIVLKAAKRPPSGRESIVAFASAWALSEYNRPDGVEALREILMRGACGGDWLAQWHAEYAAQALGRMPSAEAVRALGEALKAKPASPYVTQTVAAALARQGAPAIPHLIACLDDDRPAHRREIVWALVRLQAGAAVAVTKAFETNEDEVVRRNCLRVLGLCDAPARADASKLLECLGSTDADTRALAAWVAGRHRVGGAKEKLAGLVNDGDDVVKRLATEALKRY